MPATRATTTFITNEDVDSLALQSTRTIDIEMFAPKVSVQWVYREQPRYLTPNEPVGQEAYSGIAMLWPLPTSLASLGWRSDPIEGQSSLSRVANTSCSRPCNTTMRSGLRIATSIALLARPNRK